MVTAAFFVLESLSIVTFTVLDFSILPQLFINGIIAGSIYALVAVGFSLIFVTNRFVHFAHGAAVVTSSYILYTMLSIVGLPFWLSAILTVLSGGVLGALMYALVYHPLRKRKSSYAILLIASIGIMIFLENLMQLIFGSDVRVLTVFPIQKGIEILPGALITPLQIGIVIAGLIMLLASWLFVTKTRMGKLMRAVASHPDLAKISGINTTTIQMLSFVLGTALAAAAGVLVALELNVESTMQSKLMVKAFTSAVIGGVSSLPGSVFGSFFLGTIENIAMIWFPSGFKDAISFILLMGFLIWRPQGILGVDKGTRN